MPGAPSVAILVSGRHVANRERMFFRIADELRARGAVVEFLAAGPEAELRAALGSSYPLRNVSPLPARCGGLAIPHGWRLAAAIPPLAHYLRCRRPDVLFTTSIPPNLAGLLASAIGGANTRIVLRQSNTLRNTRPGGHGAIRRRWRDCLVRPLYARADAIVANSADVARNLRQLGISASRITTIPNGIDCDWIAAQAALPAPVPLGPYGARTLVAIGRLVPQKDHATLLRALALLRGVPLCRLIILGAGPELGSLQRMARSLGIGEQVRFAGFQPNPYPFLAAADLFVLSSRHEGMPNVLLEALACGRPIVATDCPGGPREVLADGAFGELVPVGDAVALAAAIARALAALPPPERQRTRARHYGMDAIAARYADLILDVPAPAHAADRLATA